MAHHLIGLVAFGATFGLLGVAVRRARLAGLPSWTGAPGALVDLVTIAATIVAVTQVLGVAGIYRWWALIPALLLVALAADRLARRPGSAPARPIEPAPPPLLGAAGNAIAAVGVGLGLGPWLVRSVEAFTGGVPGADTLWYHLPSAMRLVQTGSARDIVHFDPGNLTAFFPQASTYFHATGMVFFGSDIMSPVVNLGWAALALLAGWVIGRPRGVSPITMLATALTISFPGFVAHQGGSAMNDIVIFALVLSAIALLVNARLDRLTTSIPILAVAAAATGIALGTKWTALPAAAAVTIAVVVIADAGHRVRTAAVWLGVSGFFGLMTYARNWIAVGNPLPARDIALGPISFDAVVPPEDGTGSIVEWLTDGQAWDVVFEPGLRLWFGPLWIAVLLVMVFGLVGGLVFGGGRLYRLAAFVGLAALAGYLLSPQNLVFFGLPQFFVSNLRYGIVAVGLGLVLLPIVLVSPQIEPAARRRSLAGVSALVLAVLYLSSTLLSRTWTGVDDWRYQEFVGRGDTIAGILGAVVLVVLSLLLVFGADRIRPHARTLGVGAVVVGLIAVAAMRSPYLDRRYSREPFVTAARTLTDARIAIDGSNTQFQLSGPDLSNHLQWLGNTDGDVFTPVSGCAEWVQLVNDGNYTHAFLGGTALVRSGPYAWAVADPAARVVSDFSVEAEFPTAFFEFEGPLDPTGCAS